MGSGRLMMGLETRVAHYPSPGAQSSLGQVICCIMFPKLPTRRHPFLGSTGEMMFPDVLAEAVQSGRQEPGQEQRPFCELAGFRSRTIGTPLVLW